jgi:chaperone required for assembly of F1-ATPase
MNASDIPKRFYKEAGIFEDAAGFGVALDQTPVKTPGGGDFRVPTRALAKACANEWAAQGERIQPGTMPMTQWSFIALDHTPAHRQELIDQIVKYGETDLCCHRADTPAALAARQAGAWDPLLEWAERELKFSLPVVVGVIAAETTPEALAALRHAAASLDDFRLTVLAHATGLAGSVVIGFAIAKGVLDAAQASEAAIIDEGWSLERWGEDGEARARLDRLRADFAVLGRFVAALN